MFLKLNKFKSSQTGLKSLKANALKNNTLFNLKFHKEEKNRLKSDNLILKSMKNMNTFKNLNEKYSKNNMMHNHLLTNAFQFLIQHITYLLDIFGYI